MISGVAIVAAVIWLAGAVVLGANHDDVWLAVLWPLVVVVLVLQSYFIRQEFNR